MERSLVTAGYLDYIGKNDTEETNGEMGIEKYYNSIKGANEKIEKLRGKKVEE